MDTQNIARNEEIVRLRQAGNGPRSIARQMNLSPCVVAGVLHRAGLTVERTGRGHGATPEFRELVVAHARKTTQQAAADAYGVSQPTVSEWSRRSA